MCPRLYKKKGRKKEKERKKSLFKGWSVQLSHSFMSNSLLSHEPQQARPPCPSSSPMGNPNPCPLSRWYHPSISSSEVPFSSCPQSFPATRCFQMSQLFTSGCQSIGVSASKSVLPVNTQDWSPFRMNWLDLLAVQGTLKGLLQYHSSKASILQHSAQLTGATYNYLISTFSSINSQCHLNVKTES